VIFVSDGSTDDTPAVLDEAMRSYPGIFRHVPIGRTGGPGAPRNRGVREAKGEIVIIQDDDIVPEPDMLLRHAEFHRAHPEPQFSAIGEVYVPDYLLSDPMTFFHAFRYDEIRSLEKLNYLHFWTCNVSFKRQFMLDSGMHDERFLYFEDILCGYRMWEKGMELRFLPEARGKHLHQMKPSGIPAKGEFTGRWLYVFLEHYPERAVKEWFGVLSLDLPPGMLVRRVFNRIALYTLANPLTMFLIPRLGLASRRSRISDFYYYAVFRKNMLAGFRKARREARNGTQHLTPDRKPAWVNRGE
jgi:glycosyltransferase involved in cell wall biosynthesis